MKGNRNGNVQQVVINYIDKSIKGYSRKVKSGKYDWKSNEEMDIRIDELQDIRMFIVGKYLEVGEI